MITAGAVSSTSLGVTETDWVSTWKERPTEALGVAEICRRIFLAEGSDATRQVRDLASSYLYTFLVMLVTQTFHRPLLDAGDTLSLYSSIAGEASGWTEGSVYGPEVALLAYAARKGDLALFTRLAQRVDWRQQSAADLIEVVDLALLVGAHELARQLSGLAHAVYPRNRAIERIVRLLERPRNVDSRAEADPGVALDVKWIGEKTAEYEGMWVAVRGGKIIAEAESKGRLLEQLPNRRGCLILRIPG